MFILFVYSEQQIFLLSMLSFNDIIKRVLIKGNTAVSLFNMYLVYLVLSSFLALK